MRTFLPLLGAALLLGATSADAQATARATPVAARPALAGQSARVPVTVVLVDALADPSATAMIVRQPAAGDFVLMRGDRASGDILASAIFTLLVVREVSGDVPSTAMTTRVTNAAPPAAWQRSEVPRATRAVERLQDAEPQLVPGFGIRRAVTLYLPRHVLKGKLKQTAGKAAN
jgi:hypothetical protein